MTPTKEERKIYMIGPLRQRKNNLTDMTSGSPIRLILAFAIPLFIGNVFQQMYSMVDTMVAGYKLGDGAIAAIGATSSLYSLMINLASGFNSGYAIVVTQRFGAKDEKGLREALAGMFRLDLTVALVMTALSLLFLKPLMGFMNTPDAVMNDAYRYISIICAGMTATIAYNMFASILRAFGNSRTSLYFLIISSVLNIGLDLLLVALLDMGVGGAALATVIAQTVSACLSGFYVFKNYKSFMPSTLRMKVSRQTFTALFTQGLAMGLMLCVVDLGSVIFQRANNTLGPRVVSAYTAARRIIVIMMQPLGTISTAASTFVGQNWGAGKKERIKEGLRQVLLLEIAWGLISCLVAWIFGGWLVGFTTGTTDGFILDKAALSIRCSLTCFPALGCLFVLRSSMQAMGRKLIPIMSSCLELAVKFFGASVLIPRMGFNGTVITEPVTWLLMLALLAVGYRMQSREMLKN